jgi:hypothetical protein
MLCNPLAHLHTYAVNGIDVAELGPERRPVQGPRLFVKRCLSEMTLGQHVIGTWKYMTS